MDLFRAALNSAIDPVFIVDQDVTAGYASEFRQRILPELQQVRSWQQALASATRLSSRIKGIQRLAIEDSSVDLVTSSMLVSQCLGLPKQSDEDRLLPARDKLRLALLSRQVRRHFDEVRRILAPGGIYYLSFEIFHLVPDSRRWFLVEGIPIVMEAVGERFHFNFDVIAKHEMMSNFETRNEPSLVFAAVLEPKTTD